MRIIRRKKKKDDTKHVMGCFDCQDNKMKCRECPDMLKCTGCIICGTSDYISCIHCPIICKHENVCTYRKEFINEISVTADNTSQQISRLCDECPHDYTCYVNGKCPADGSVPAWIDKDEEEEWKAYFEDQRGAYIARTNEVRHINNITYHQNNLQGQNQKQEEDMVWNSGACVIDKCPHEGKEIEYRLSLDVVLKLRYLQGMFPDVEFTVYGNAVKREDGSYLLLDIVIPVQKARHSAVDEIVCDGVYNTIIHKHPGNCPSFSGTDKEFANSNHDFSILIGSSDLNKIDTCARILTECNRYVSGKLKVELEYPNIDDTRFLRSVENITKDVSTYVSPYNPKWAGRFQGYL